MSASNRNRISETIYFLLQLVYQKQTSGEKRKALKKKVCSLQRFFCGHVYSTDLIGHIRRTSEEKTHAD